VADILVSGRGRLPLMWRGVGVATASVALAGLFEGWVGTFNCHRITSRFLRHLSPVDERLYLGPHGWRLGLLSAFATVSPRRCGTHIQQRTAVDGGRAGIRFGAGRADPRVGLTGPSTSPNAVSSIVWTALGGRTPYGSTVGWTCHRLGDVIQHRLHRGQ